MKKLTALFAFAFFLLFVGWAITPLQADAPRPFHDHGDGGEAGVTYTAQLCHAYTSLRGLPGVCTVGDMVGDGAFEWLGSVRVFPNEKETDLRFDAIPMVSPHGGVTGSAASLRDWYRVFDDCDVFDDGDDHVGTLDEAFLPDTPIMVATSAGPGGGVRVFIFGGIDYGNPEVGVVVQLIGDCFNTDGCNADFIPEPGNTSEFTLFEALLQGNTTAQGKKGNCNKDRGRVTLESPSTLRITASCPDGLPPTCS
jgi:hypothetical protein